VVQLFEYKPVLDFYVLYKAIEEVGIVVSRESETSILKFCQFAVCSEFSQFGHSIPSIVFFQFEECSIDGDCVCV